MKGSGVREGYVFCQAPIAWLYNTLYTLNITTYLKFLAVCIVVNENQYHVLTLTLVHATVASVKQWPVVTSCCLIGLQRK